MRFMHLLHLLKNPVRTSHQGYHPARLIRLNITETALAVSFRAYAYAVASLLRRGYGGVTPYRLVRVISYQVGWPHRRVDIPVGHLMNMDIPEFARGER